MAHYTLTSYPHGVIEISDTQVRDILLRPTATMHQLAEMSNVDINYVPLLWKSLNEDQISEDPTPIIVSVTNEELTALLAVDRGVLDGILRNKIRPAFLQQQCICIACQTQPASLMINTIAFYPQAPEGPTIVDSTPFAVCDSTACIHRATRRAHSHCSEISAADPGFADVESEVCDNCNVIQNVSIHGRLKRCTQCKAMSYCSKKCQTKHWYKTHKYFCKSDVSK